jgi:uncharacterized protein (DUF488 family)
MSHASNIAHGSTVLTIGHSNHSAEQFLGLVQSQTIEVVADVRSHPYSRFAPHFSQEALKAALQQIGVKYVFLGAELGGRPDGEAYYDDDGHVLYGRVARAPFFIDGIERLERGLTRVRVAIMCSEEDPTNCHRRLLIARVLRDRDIEVLHLRGNGRLQRDAELGAATQGDLFSGFEEGAWRSTRSVLRGSAPIASSAS